MNRKEVINTLNELAFYLELDEENQFKIRAYTNAAKALLICEFDNQELVSKLQNNEIRSIGKQIAKLIIDLILHDSNKELDVLKNKYPNTLLELNSISGLGTKKISLLHNEHKISTLEELITACEKKELEKIKGFGKKTQDSILENAKNAVYYRPYLRLDHAIEISKSIRELFENTNFQAKVLDSGALLRGFDITNELSFIVLSNADISDITNTLKNYKAILINKTNDKTINCSLTSSKTLISFHCYSEELLSAAKKIELGSSAEHFSQLQEIANNKQINLNKYQSQSELYNDLGLAEIPVELREGKNEIALAANYFLNNQNFPKLIEQNDIKGILHAHSTYSDGVHTLREMASACKNIGYEYLGISDHSQSAAYAGGLKAKDILKQHAEIDQLNIELAPFVIFKGIESDILKDGSLDYPDEILDSFDFVIASIHTRYAHSKAETTERICKAIENPFTTFLAHPSGRLLLKREGYEFDYQTVFACAKKHNVGIEINANPKRLDLDWRYINSAREHGILLPISPDAHDYLAYKYIDYGIRIARKGMLTTSDILNTKTKEEIFLYFKNKKAKSLSNRK